jgi:hypothetical protein
MSLCVRLRFTLLLLPRIFAEVALLMIWSCLLISAVSLSTPYVCDTWRSFSILHMSSTSSASLSDFGDAFLAR